MARLITFIFVTLLALPRGGVAETTTLQDDRDRLSYSIGYQVGGDFKRQGLEIRKEALVRGILDSLGGDEAAMSSEDMRETLVQLRQDVVARREAERKVAGEANLKASDAFLSANAGKPGVVTTASGLQYKVIHEGSGKTPAPGDKVTVHYRGTLVDGTEFDSSYARGAPATFASNQVIKGWIEALALMQEGDKWELYIPPDLAYGESGAGPKIGPNSALIFEVELLSVDSAQ